MAVGKPPRRFKDSLAAKKITPEMDRSEFCIGLKEGVLEAGYTGEIAAVEAGDLAESRAAESDLSLEV